MGTEPDDEWTTADLTAAIDGPWPEGWTDVIRVLAERVTTELAGRGTHPIDEAAIVRNFATTIDQAAVIIEGFVGGNDHTAVDWAEIRGHLNAATKGLRWIAEGWI